MHKMLFVSQQLQTCEILSLHLTNLTWTVSEYHKFCKKSRGGDDK